MFDVLFKVFSMFSYKTHISNASIRSTSARHIHAPASDTFFYIFFVPYVILCYRILYLEFPTRSIMIILIFQALIHYISNIFWSIFLKCCFLYSHLLSFFFFFYLIHPCYIRSSHFPSSFQFSSIMTRHRVMTVCAP